jgi:xylan 1,4-beta-xylosidase
VAHYAVSFIGGLVDYCLAHGCELDFLSWHELDSVDRPADVEDHLVAARAAYIADPRVAAVKIGEININESLSPDASIQPGAVVAMLYHLEHGGADGAARSCWVPLDGTTPSNCFNGSLDGLIEPRTELPRSIWWAYRSYADGASSRIQGSSSGDVVAIGSGRSSAPETGQVLVGNSGASAPSVILQLQNLSSLPFVGSRQAVHVNVKRIPAAGEAVVIGLPLVLDRDYPVVDGAATVTLDDIAAYETYTLTIR